MRKVTREELLDYATYSDRRDAIRSAVMEVKAPRRIHVGDVLTFLFENTETVRYQVQEMMRAERIVREADVAHELDTYNELLGGPGELGAVLLIEIADAEARTGLLREWAELPEHLYAELGDGRRVRATFDGRQRDGGKLSSVQYLKFDVGGEVPVALGSDLTALTLRTALSEAQREALRADLAEAA